MGRLAKWHKPQIGQILRFRSLNNLLQYCSSVQYEINELGIIMYKLIPTKLITQHQLVFSFVSVEFLFFSPFTHRRRTPRTAIAILRPHEKAKHQRLKIKRLKFHTNFFISHFLLSIFLGYFSQLSEFFKYVFL